MCLRATCQRRRQGKGPNGAAWRLTSQGSGGSGSALACWQCCLLQPPRPAQQGARAGGVVSGIAAPVAGRAAGMRASVPGDGAVLARPAQMAAMCMLGALLGVVPQAPPQARMHAWAPGRLQVRGQRDHATDGPAPPCMARMAGCTALRLGLLLYIHVPQAEPQWGRMRHGAGAVPARASKQARPALGSCCCTWHPHLPCPTLTKGGRGRRPGGGGPRHVRRAAWGDGRDQRQRQGRGSSGGGDGGGAGGRPDSRRGVLRAAIGTLW